MQQTNSRLGSAKTLPCSCKHDAQDRLHGPGVRVHNAAKNKLTSGKTVSAIMWVCTVCGAKKDD